MLEVTREQALSRTRRLLGRAAMARLQAAHVAVFGLGGVGGHAAEALARSGIGTLTLIDGDVVSPSNLNRQLVALTETLGESKAEALARRLREAMPGVVLHAYTDFYTPDTSAALLKDYDYVLDAIDDVPNKIDLIKRCHTLGIPILSSMGAGNRLDPQRFRITDMEKTRVDPLAKRVRKALRDAGIRHHQAAWSPETPADIEREPGAESTPASIAFVPSAVGLLLAGQIVRDIAGVKPGRDGV